MLRLLSPLLALLLLAPALAAPVPKGLKKKCPDVTGTAWVCDESKADLGLIEYTFCDGGKLTRHGLNRALADGTWTQDGTSLSWKVNNFVDYTTEFDGEAFVGGAVNLNKTKWAITLKPKEEKK